ncbi:MAG: hypothetical protein ACI4AK_01395 [Lepagella sp.]
MNKGKITTPSSVAASEAVFEGYTIEELRYQRAMLAIRKEFAKEKLLESVKGLNPAHRSSRDKALSGEGKYSLLSKLAGNALRGLKAFDYVVLGLSAIGVIRKGYRLIKGKK